MRRVSGEVLGCRIGRESPGHWVDFELFGHQLTAHLRPGHSGVSDGGLVDDDVVPIPHFGVILEMGDWRSFTERLQAQPTIRWGLKPKIRFVGQPGEQGTLFIFDPSGNGLEFKGLADSAAIFAR